MLLYRTGMWGLSKERDPRRGLRAVCPGQVLLEHAATRMWAHRGLWSLLRSSTC